MVGGGGTFRFGVGDCTALLFRGGIDGTGRDMLEDVESADCSGTAGGRREEGRVGGGGGAEGEELRPGGCGTLRDGAGALAIVGGSGAARESELGVKRFGTFGAATGDLVGGVGRPGGGGGGAFGPASRRGMEGGFPSDVGFAEQLISNNVQQSSISYLLRLF